MKSLALAAALLVLSCTPVAAPPVPSPQETRSETVSLSAEHLGSNRVRLILQNEYERGVEYNLCSSALQKWSGSQWQDVNTGEVCTMELRTLPPGQDATFEKTPPSLTPGRYRYVTTVYMAGVEGGTVLATTDFEVQ